MMPLALLPEPLLWLVALLALSALAFGFYAVLNPHPFVKGQDAAGKGMAIGCILILSGLLCFVLGLFTAGASYLAGSAYRPLTHLLAWTPASLVLLLALGSFIIEKLRQRAHVREQYLREMAQPLFVIVHAAPDLYRMFEALQQLDPKTEQQLWEHPAAFYWQFDRFLPRCRVISLHAGLAHPTQPDQFPDTAERLAKALAEEPPTCPILLVGTDEPALSHLQSILSPKWRIARLVLNPSDPAWISTQWLPALQQLTDIPALHPADP